MLSPGVRRHYRRTGRLAPATAIFVVCLLALAAVETAAQLGNPIRTWKGGHSGNRWSVAANWSPAGVPQSGDDLIFGQDGQNQRNMDNDCPGFVAGGVTIQTSGYRIGGLGLTLAADSVSSIGGGEFTVASLAGGAVRAALAPAPQVARPEP